MSLQDNLKFNKQQEKSMAALGSIGTKSSKATKPHRAIAPSDSLTSQIKPSAPAVKFSNNTERLQHINSIRKAPIGAQIKRVIDLLLETRQALTAEQINEACYVDTKANKAVFDSLRNNLKVKYDGECFSYKSKHDLKDEDELLRLIRKFPDGIAVIDLKDAYPTVMEDLQALKGAKKIWLLSNFDSQEDVAYPTDPKISIDVDAELKQMYREVELPRDFIDIEKYLLKNGMKPFTNTAARRAAAQAHGIPSKPKLKKKNKDINKRTKLTNYHLPDLFERLKAPAGDQ